MIATPTTIANLVNTDIDALKARLKATWMDGNYDYFSRFMKASAVEFLDRLGVDPGDSLLDVACGSGQLALIAASMGANVSGVDIATNAIVAARGRAAAEGYNIRFDEGDAEALPYEAASFDVVASLFGAMFAPRPELVAAELAEIAGEDIEQYGQEIFAAAAADLSARPAESLITADFKEFTVGDTKFAIGTIETASPATIEQRIPELLKAMQRIAQERGYASLLFMLVDIINMQCHLLIWGGEQAVAEVLGVPLEPDGHSVIVEGLVSRKKQLVPLLSRIQATMTGRTGAL